MCKQNAVFLRVSCINWISNSITFIACYVYDIKTAAKESTLSVEWDCNGTNKNIIKKKNKRKDNNDQYEIEYWVLQMQYILIDTTATKFTTNNAFYIIIISMQCSILFVSHFLSLFHEVFSFNVLPVIWPIHLHFNYKICSFVWTRLKNRSAVDKWKKRRETTHRSYVP